MKPARAHPTRDLPALQHPLRPPLVPGRARLSDSATVSEIAFRDIDIADLATAPAHSGAHAALSPARACRIVITHDVWGKRCGKPVMSTNITVDGVALHGAVIPAQRIVRV